MRVLDKKIRDVVESLSIQTRTVRTRETPAVNNLLEQLLKNLKLLEKQSLDEEKNLLVTYDLLLIYSKKIEDVYQGQDWTVEQLLLLLDECYNHPRMPEAMKKNLPLRRGLITYKYASWGSVYDLSKLVYQRFQSMLYADFPMSMDRRLKVTLGNVFAGYQNSKILLEIYPSILQLGLPMGQLKEEYDGFLNQLLTDFLTDPKLNKTLSVLTIGNRFADSRPMLFDFKEVLSLLLDLSDGDIRYATGETPESLDVRIVARKTSLLKQLRVLLFSGSPTKMEIALHHRPALQAIFLKILSPMSQLQSLYTWGSGLDDAFNRFVDEVKIFASQMLSVLTPLTTLTMPVETPWDIVRLWGGPKHAISSGLDMTTAMFRSFMPKLNVVLQFFMPEDSFGPLVKKCKEPVANIRENMLQLVLNFERLGIYDDATQAAIAPFREQFAELNLDAIQAMFAIYKNQFEQFILQPDQAKLVWGRLPVDRQREVLMNAAALFYHLNAFLRTVMPFLSIDKLRTMREALADKPEIRLNYDGLIVGVMKLQTMLKENFNSIKKLLLDVFSTAGDRLSFGDATYSVVSSNGGGGHSMLGSVASGFVGVFGNHRLNLDFNPSEQKVEGLPPTWQGKKLKAILKQEIEQTFMILEQFDALGIAQVFVMSNSHNPIDTLTL